MSDSKTVTKIGFDKRFFFNGKEKIGKLGNLGIGKSQKEQLEQFCPDTCSSFQI